jgi:hypothetical protein
MLKPGGTLLLTVPAHQSLWSYFDEVGHHCRRYERVDVRTKLTQTGCEIEFLSEFMASIYPLMWFVRRIKSKWRRDNSKSGASELELSMEELRIVPLVNGLLTFLLKARGETDKIATRAAIWNIDNRRGEAGTVRAR